MVRMPSATPHTRALVRCHQWPVMLVLPQSVDALLGDVVADARSVTGERIYKKDIVAAFIVLKAPETPDELARLFWDYAASNRFGGSPLKLPKTNLTVALPAPVSHRLDLLVAGAREGRAAAMRRDLVSALVTLRVPNAANEAYVLYRQYLACSARDARVPGRPLKSVLTLSRPKPGRRPM